MCVKRIFVLSVRSIVPAAECIFANAMQMRCSRVLTAEIGIARFAIQDKEYVWHARKKIDN